MKWKCNLLFSIVYILGAYVLQGQSLDLSNQKHFGISDGLSNGSIMHMVQDEYGFLWIATSDGLNRYDGYDFVHFQLDNSENNGLVDGFISGLSVDQDQLLVSTQTTGINVYDNSTNTFTKSKLNLSQDEFIHPGKTIYSSKDGNIYLGTITGLYKISKSDQSTTQLLQGTSIYVIHQSPDQTIWVGTGEGLYYVNEQNQLSKERIGIPHNKIINEVSSDNFGNLIVASKSGLFIKKENVWQEIKPQRDYKLNDIRSIVTDKDNNIWLGGQNGLMVFENNNYGISSDNFLEIKKSHLNNINIGNLYLDKEENLWIGTANNGLIQLLLSKDHFKSYRQSSTPLQGGTPVNTVRSIFIEDEDHIWLGSYGGGLYNFNRKDNLYTNYKADSQTDEALSGNQISSIFKDSQGDLWIGTWGDGLNKFKNGKFKRYYILENQEEEVNQFSSIQQLFEDQIGNVWAVTNEGIAVKRPDKDQFESISKYLQIPGQSINHILEDKEGNWWIGTWNGLFIVQSDLISIIKNSLPSNNLPLQIQKHQHSIESTSLSNNRITHIHQDHKDRIWISTYGGGLNLWLSNSSDLGQFKSYNEKNGLSNGTIYGIEEDQSGRLWLSTNNGLSLFDPETEIFQNYYKENGLQSNQFYFGAFGTLPNNELIFGGNNGFNIFNPLLFSSPAKIPTKVLINKLSVQGVEVKPGESTQLEKAISVTQDIEFDYKDNSFRLEFASNTFNNATNLIYAYRLNGAQENWQTVNSNERFASFINLHEGDYLFEVKSSIDSKNWSTPTLLHINIKPPWHRTTWAYLLFGLFILSIIAGISWLTYIYSNLRNKIKLEKLEREQEAEVSKMKSWFFTYISHEFKTPLTLILSPLHEMLVDKTVTGNTRKSMDIAYANSQRLLRLVNQLLNFNKIGAGKVRIRATELNIVEESARIFDSFNHFSESRNIIKVFSVDKKEIPIWFDPEKLEIILYNLLSNAFKHSEAGNTVSMIIEEKANQVLIKIKDEGPGIKVEDEAHIFEPFYKVNTNSYDGTGIGLSVVKDLIELHSGAVTLSSEVGKGSTFVLMLQKGQDFLSENQKIKYDNTKVASSFLEPIHIKPKEAIEVSYARNIATKEKPSLLIIEDDEQTRNYFKDHFTKTFRVSEAKNGKAGLDSIKKSTPDIIICDVLMPIMDGFTFCKEINNNDNLRHIPIILLTSKSSAANHLEGFKQGAIDYIPKPVNIEILEARVFSILQNIQNLKAHYKYNAILPTTENQISKDEKFMLKAALTVEHHMGNKGFNTQSFAKEMGISRSGLYKKVYANTQKSTTQFIRFIRLKHAEKLLIAGHHNISESAFKVGFNDLKYFRKCFKEEFGITPSEMITKHIKPVQEIEK